ncbi:MAG: glycosyltransferase family 4 protein [bacterium]
MKILYSHRTRSADGQFVHIRALNDAFLRAGHEVLLVGPEGIQHGSAIYDQPLDAGMGGKAGWPAYLPRIAYEMAEMAYTLPAYQRLLKAAKAFQPHFIYERYNLFFPAGTWVKQKTKRPFLLEVNAPLREERARHGGLALKGMAGQIERSVWQAADQLFPVTNVLADYLRDAGVPDDKIQVIANGIDADFLQPRDGQTVRRRLQLQDKMILGFTGFVRQWHGVETILEYIAARANKELHLLLVGDGPYAEDLRKKVQALNISDQLTITGVIQKQDLPDYIASFDIALQPKVTAYASPLKLFEYMGLSRAIIAPAQANIQEILTDGHDAALFQPSQKHSLYRALDRLVTDPKLRCQMGVNARETVLDRELSWEANARRVVATAQSLLASKT